MELHEETCKSVHQRLLSVRGHVDGILKMLDTGPYCVDVLRQLKAVQGALDKCGQLILKSHLRDHVVHDRDDAEKLVDELMEVLKYRS